MKVISQTRDEMFNYLEETTILNLYLPESLGTKHMPSFNMALSVADGLYR